MQNPGAFGLSYEALQPVTRGIVTTDIETVLYKDGPSMLSSMQDYVFGFLGSQQYPYAATTGTTAVFGRSGLSDNFVNIHMPKVRQVSNAALIKYDSVYAQQFAALLAQFGETNFNVYMF